MTATPDHVTEKNLAEASVEQPATVVHGVSNEIVQGGEGEPQRIAAA
jgi:hypothetical protein